MVRCWPPDGPRPTRHCRFILLHLRVSSALLQEHNHHDYPVIKRISALLFSFTKNAFLILTTLPALSTQAVPLWVALP